MDWINAEEEKALPGWRVPGKETSDLPKIEEEEFPTYECPFRMEVQKLIEFVQKILENENGELEGADPKIVGGNLMVKSSPRKLRRVGQFIEKLRLLRNDRIDLKIDLIRCDPQAVLELILNSPSRPLVLTEDERKALFSRLSRNSPENIIFSQSVRATNGKRIEISFSRSRLEDRNGSQGGTILRLLPMRTPGGAILRIAGILDTFSEPKKTEAPSAMDFRYESSQAQLKGEMRNEKLYIPENRTVLAGIAGIPSGAENRMPVLFFIRVKTNPGLFHIDLGNGIHAFDIRDVLRSGFEFEGPEITLKTKDEMNGEEIDVSGSEAGEDKTASFSAASEWEASFDCTAIIDMIKEFTGGDEAWEEGNWLDSHFDVLYVRTYNRVLLEGIEKVLSKFRSRFRDLTQVSTWWLSLDREAARAFQEGGSEDRGLLREDGLKLLKILGEGRSGRVVDGTGVTFSLGLSDTVSTFRGDGWRDLRWTPGSSSGPFSRSKEGEVIAFSSCDYDFHGDPVSEKINVNFQSQLETIFPTSPGIFEAVKSRLETRLFARNGVSYLLGGGPLLSDGRSEIYLLLNVAWMPLPAIEPPAEKGVSASEEIPEGLSELAIPLIRAENAIRKGFSEKVVFWSQGKPVPLTSFVIWLSDAAGTKIFIDPAMNGEEISVEPPDLGPMPASRFLDLVCRTSGLGWTFCQVGVLITEREKAKPFPASERYWDVPSIEDYLSPKDRETFRALSQEVEIDLSKIKLPRDLFEEIARATKTRYIMASRELREADFQLEFRSFPPRGPKLIPAILLTDLKGQISWYLNEGIVFYER